jgi:hypothetical protein
MDRNTNFFIDLLRLLPEEAQVVISCYDDEVLAKLRPLEDKSGAISLKKRRELIKLLVCEGFLVDFVHIEISQGGKKYLNAYDRMMMCWLHKPIELPARFINKYKLTESDGGWEYESAGFDGLEQFVLLLE